MESSEPEVNRLLTSFFRGLAEDVDLERSLVIVSEERVRHPP